MDVQEVRTRLGLVDEALARFEPRDPTPRQIAGIFNALHTEALAARPDDALLAGIEPNVAPAGHEAPRSARCPRAARRRGAPRAPR